MQIGSKFFKPVCRVLKAKHTTKAAYHKKITSQAKGYSNDDNLTFLPLCTWPATTKGPLYIATEVRYTIQISRWTCGTPFTLPWNTTRQVQQCVITQQFLKLTPTQKEHQHYWAAVSSINSQQNCDKLSTIASRGTRSIQKNLLYLPTTCVLQCPSSPDDWCIWTKSCKQYFLSIFRLWKPF